MSLSDDRGTHIDSAQLNARRAGREMTDANAAGATSYRHAVMIRINRDDARSTSPPLVRPYAFVF
jgi:hypothetical protein